MIKSIFTATLLAVLVVCACGAEPTTVPDAIKSPLSEPTADSGAFESPLNMANPASKFCVDQGYRLEIRDEAGGEVGYCIFPDGTECEEWAYQRGECEPGAPKP